MCGGGGAYLNLMGGPLIEGPPMWGGAGPRMNAGDLRSMGPGDRSKGGGERRIP